MTSATKKIVKSTVMVYGLMSSRGVLFVCFCSKNSFFGVSSPISDSRVHRCLLILEEDYLSCSALTVLDN
jgi:hypothetical protein